MNTKSQEWWLDRVAVEVAVVERPDGVFETRADPSAVRIADGVVADVRRGERAPDDGRRVFDAGGMLLMPAMRDTHIHLDKTFYGGPWRAPIPGRSWLAEEERLLPEMSEQIPVRSNAILDLLVSRGTTEVAAHCNVDHIVGTRNVERLLDVLRSRADVDWTVIAYPQHGLRDGTVVPMLERALGLGATVVGGIDPARIEGDVAKALDVTFGLAVEHGAGIDFHLHDGGSLGLFEIDQILRFVEATGWQGKVMLSNANALSGASADAVRDLAARLAAARVAVGTTVGVNGALLPFRALDEAGVDVSLGSDSIMDILTPFGPGDLLEQLWILAQRLGAYDEWGIAQTLHYAAGEAGRWRADRTRGWPAVGDQASFFLTPATCSAEAIARRTPRRYVFHRGVRVYAGKDL
ncbi:amidohydrolase family protein [Kribbella sp.]|uniref:amidohydrolase family protein n=1 Tax=Kribbella sp. TaxID=1871183 RepID=UPI002D2DA4EF|nr:amidohydrolase family protein [Kribbella sp.]HZX02091.1 amidohydrolase family protein [Kribbella sp.]